MPKIQQLDNPGGAFGYSIHEQHPQGETRRVYNATTVAIQRGQPVKFSTISSQGSGALQCSASDPALGGFGVALTSAPAGSTLETTAVPSSVWFEVVTRGPAVAQMSSNVTESQPLILSATAGELTSAAATGVGFVRVFGVSMTTATTGSTGFLDTALNRGLAWIDPQLIVRSSVAG